MNSPRFLSARGDATPQLSASDSRLPDYSALGAKTRNKSFTLAQDNLQPSECELEWCQLLAATADISYMRLYLLDMFAHWKTNRGCFAVFGFGTDTFRTVKDAEAWGAFFSYLQKNKAKQCSYRVAVKGGWKIFPTLEDLSEFAASAIESFLIAVVPEKAKRVRSIPWQRDYTDASTPCSPSSSYQHSLGKFRYAGQLMRSSFSPYLPYSSVLSEMLPRTATFSADLCDLVTCVQRFMKKENYTLHSMSLNVTEDSSGNLYLLHITNIVWAEYEKVTLPPVLSASASTPTISPIVRKLNAKKSAKMLFAKELARPPYIDAAEIQRMNIDMYAKTISGRIGRLRQRTGDNLESTTPLSPVAQSLSSIAEKFDQQRQQLEQTRIVQKRTAMLGLDLKEIVRKAYGRFESDEVLGRFFQSGVGIQHLSEQFYMALTTPKNYYLSRRIHSVHHRYGITEEHFELFVSKFREVLLESGASSEDIASIMSNLNEYKQDIVLGSRVS